ncbi:MAG: pyruvate kinase [Ktedonobacterales bacterium]|nr:pyruvate kinase [Ktedonobacterales bacterium]
MLRRTKIVCTIGPATSSEESITELIEAGMDVARLNFSHGTHEEHATTIARARAAAARLGRPVAILQDLQGPKIRTGALGGGGPVVLRDGQHFTITTEPVVGTVERVATTYVALPRDVKPGDRILLSDGAIELRVVRVADPEVMCEVVHGGQLAEHQGINLPGVAVSAPALTEKDRDDLAFGVRQRVDLVALSFVRRPEDLHTARRFIEETLRAEPGGHPPGRDRTTDAAEKAIPVIAKLEKPEAIERLDAILRASDGVMVARGDLGVEMPLEAVPVLQKRIIAHANALGLPVITATQMLESMLQNPRPTRAEASDVANAILDGTDAVMLSGETAVGAYPLAAVRVMVRIAEETESHYTAMARSTAEHATTHTQAVSRAAHTLAREAHATLLVVFTRSGLSAHLISQERPAVPIIAYTPSETVYRRLALWWGVMPCLSEPRGTTEEVIAWMDAHVRRLGLAQVGDFVVMMGGMPVAGRARTNFVKLHRVGEG